MPSDGDTRLQTPRPALPRERATHRVLLAIHLRSDEEGLTCRAGGDLLAASASVTRRELARALAELVESGWIEIVSIPPGRPESGRVIVLMDHEAARRYLAELRAMPRAAREGV